MIAQYYSLILLVNSSAFVTLKNLHFVHLLYHKVCACGIVQV